MMKEITLNLIKASKIVYAFCFFAVSLIWQNPLAAQGLDFKNKELHALKKSVSTLSNEIDETNAHMSSLQQENT